MTRGQQRYLVVRTVLERCIVLVLLPAIVCGILVTGMLVACSIGQPLLFRQWRPGRHGKLFELVKFRTMTVSDASGVLRPVEHDVRLTRLTRWIRKHRLDELPQLLQVLSGRMSIVGPRPLPLGVLDAVQQADAQRWKEVRTLAPPGLTGLAQVRMGYTYDARQERQKLRFDALYVSRLGWRLDAYILWHTVRMLFHRRRRLPEVLYVDTCLPEDVQVGPMDGAR